MISTMSSDTVRVASTPGMVSTSARTLPETTTELSGWTLTAEAVRIPWMGIPRTAVSIARKPAYTVDAHACIRGHVAAGVLVPVSFATENENSRFLGLAHPGMTMTMMTGGSTTVRNPCDLSNGVVVTGPNASGKSTYARAALCATLMAQSIGFACAHEARIRVFDSIHSHMRITDRLEGGEGDGESLFQAELGMCKRVLASASARPTIVFLDEPFHSVSPNVGDSIARAFLRRFRDFGASVMVTSHYPGVAELGRGEGFCVVGFGAHATFGSAPTFTYRLTRGRSEESVVLDMIRSETDDRVLEYAHGFLAGEEKTDTTTMPTSALVASGTDDAALPGETSSAHPGP